MKKFKRCFHPAAKASFLSALVALAITLTGANAWAQSVFTTGLKAPSKIVFTTQGSLVVAESGDGPNTGRISIVDRVGNRRTLLDGLPSGLAAPNNEPSGPEGLKLNARTLYIAIGVGDVVKSGPGPGTEAPNSEGPSSPILSSLLAAKFNTELDDLTSGFVLPLDDHFALADGSEVTKTNADGSVVTLELVEDFRDLVRDPRTTVRPSHPFGLELSANYFNLADAGMNSIVQVCRGKCRPRTLLKFAPLPNPLPFGPPVVEAVPANVHRIGDHLLVPLLTGFPFPPGVSQVRKVNIQTGKNELFIGGLTMAIDVIPVKRGGVEKFYVLEFSTAPLANAPGRLLRFDAMGRSPIVVAENLLSPTNLAFDWRSGELFVTEFFTGRIVRVPIP